MCVGLGWVPNGSVAASPPLHGLSIQNKTSTRQGTLGRGQGSTGTHRLLCLIAPARAATVQGVQWAEPRVPGREATVACLPAATSLTWVCEPGAAASLFHQLQGQEPQRAEQQATLGWGGQEGDPVSVCACTCT